jgi:hypothetical protein
MLFPPHPMDVSRHWKLIAISAKHPLRKITHPFGQSQTPPAAGEFV